ncbi:hypothetical protein CKO31_14360 [Thiohalocapsa halophila]|uniref:Uncharacterized protein n=1 Tax=Thiohalocapsa halophila TaxID=69359 RepID=A0ABS1CIZ4_9GAMM|nr:hypothetical protein [Thiohalocapsa halophila]
MQPILRQQARDARKLGEVVRHGDRTQRDTLRGDPEITGADRGAEALQMGSDLRVRSADPAIQWRHFHPLDQFRQASRVVLPISTLFDRRMDKRSLGRTNQA